MRRHNAPLGGKSADSEGQLWGWADARESVGPFGNFRSSIAANHPHKVSVAADTTVNTDVPVHIEAQPLNIS